MCNVAIIIGESIYDSDDIENLDACKNDAERIKSIIDDSNRFDYVLDILNNSSDEIYDKLVEIKNNYESIKELIFYYSGHGYQDDDDFYYITKNTQLNKLNQTSLKNKDLDKILRELKPNLLIKFIDACNSGSQYIKEINDYSEIRKKLEESKVQFNDCYFMYSSSKNQNSGANVDSSFFTKALIESIKDVFEKREEVKYRDLENGIADYFSNHEKQKPYFVNQNFNDDVFLCKNDNLLKTVNKIVKEMNKKEKNRTETKEEPSKRNLCSKSMALNCKLEVFEYIKMGITENLKLLPTDGYNIIDNNIDPNSVVFKEDVGHWINDYKDKKVLFAEIDLRPVWNGIFHFSTPPDDYEISGFKLNIDQANSIIEYDLVCKEYALPKYSIQIISIYSINYLYLIYGVNKAIPKNWEEYDDYQKMNNIRIKKISIIKKDEYESICNEIVTDIYDRIVGNIQESLSAYEQ